MPVFSPARAAAAARRSLFALHAAAIITITTVSASIRSLPHTVSPHSLVDLSTFVSLICSYDERVSPGSVLPS